MLLVLALVVAGGVWWLRRRSTAAVARRLVTGVGLVLVALLVSTAGVLGWARSATDRCQLARAIAWGDSDTDDIDRFPSREIAASSRPAPFAPGPSDGLVEAYREPGAETAFVDTLADRQTRAFLVVSDGRLIYEAYFNGAGPTDRHTSFSMAKSFVATLVGIAQAEGRLASLAAPITDHLPELAERDIRFERITIHHLLSMASGLAFREGVSPWADPANTYYGTDLRTAALETTEVATEPGTFHYNDWNTILLGLILERATGTSLSDYLQSRLWDPLGAEGSASWSLDSVESGFEKSFVGVNARPIDFTKLGWLYLNDGQGPTGPIVPAEFVRAATASDTEDNGVRRYQHQWWVDESDDGFFAAGDHCQFVYVHRPSRTVLARLGSGCGDTDWPAVLGDLARWLAESGGGGG